MVEGYDGGIESFSSLHWRRLDRFDRRSGYSVLSWIAGNLGAEPRFSATEIRERGREKGEGTESLQSVRWSCELVSAASGGKREKVRHMQKAKWAILPLTL